MIVFEPSPSSLAFLREVQEVTGLPEAIAVDVALQATRHALDTISAPSAECHIIGLVVTPEIFGTLTDAARTAGVPLAALVATAATVGAPLVVAALAQAKSEMNGGVN